MTHTLEYILDFCKEHRITAYKIAKYTTLTEAGVRKILSNESKNPSKRTVTEIHHFLSQEYADYEASDVSATDTDHSKLFGLLDQITDNDQLIADLKKGILKLVDENTALKEKMKAIHSLTGANMLEMLK